MEKRDIIFFAILIIAYIICSVTMNIPLFVHCMFIGLIIIVLFISTILKYQQKFENAKISRIADILSAIFLILYIICIIYEIFFHKTLIIESSALIMPFFGALVVSWFFKKEE